MKLYEIKFFILLTGLFIFAYLLPIRQRWLIYLIGSFCFLLYPHNFLSIYVLLGSAGGNFTIGILFTKLQKQIYRKWLLALGIIFNLALLNLLKLQLFFFSSFRGLYAGNWHLVLHA